MEHLSEKELLELANRIGSHSRELNEEWFKRFGLNFPYKLTDNNKIFNCLLLNTVKDSDCDKLIVEQANMLRGGT